MRRPPIKLDGLTVHQRLGLLEDVWESLSSTPQRVPLTKVQRAELDRRLDDVEQGDTVGIPWDQVLKQIRRRRR